MLIFIWQILALICNAVGSIGRQAIFAHYDTMCGHVTLESQRLQIIHLY